MRRYSDREDKVYITNSWCVSGDQIQLQQPLRTQKYANKNININNGLEEVEEPYVERVSVAKKIEKNNRKTIKLNTTDYKNLQVSNKQLRHIYETVEVEDFERILNNICISSTAAAKKINKTEDKILKKYEEEADDIYEEFFGQYYSELRDVINSRSKN